MRALHKDNVNGDELFACTMVQCEMFGYAYSLQVRKYFTFLLSFKSSVYILLPQHCKSQYLGPLTSEHGYYAFSRSPARSVHKLYRFFCVYSKFVYSEYAVIINHFPVPQTNLFLEISTFIAKSKFQIFGRIFPNNKKLSNLMSTIVFPTQIIASLRSNK